jgi:hypothetical protein
VSEHAWEIVGRTRTCACGVRQYQAVLGAQFPAATPHWLPAEVRDCRLKRAPVPKPATPAPARPRYVNRPGRAFLARVRAALASGPGSAPALAERLGVERKRVSEALTCLAGDGVIRCIGKVPHWKGRGSGKPANLYALAEGADAG